MWKKTVHEVYESLEDLIEWDEIYSVVSRCGYESAEKLWKDNRMLQGSSDPKDFGLLKRGVKQAIQRELVKISSKYWEEIPLAEIMDVLRMYGGTLIQEDGTEWSGILCGTAEVVDIAVKGIKCNGLSLGWYKMASGRYEINAYLM
jgi:hypothetical protein